MSEVPYESESELRELKLEEYIRSYSARIERNLLLKTLEKSGGNRTLAAEKLGISRKTLFNKLKRHGIK
jgi:transcriptional regulator of acetoin/glycerol metabolism